MELETQAVEPAVAPADVNPGQDTTQATAADAQVESQEQAKERTFTQAEVDALIQKRLLKEERRVHRRVEQQLRQQQTAPAPVPRREAFQTDEAFSQAQIEHLIAQKAEQMVAERERQREAERVQETFFAKAEAASEKYPDFDAVVTNPALHISNDMAEWIADSDAGPDVAYHLGKNPLLASRIAQMTPVKAARELARIESELVSKPKAKPSNAPEPIKPVGRGSTSSSLPSDNDSMEEWVRKERARMRSL